MRVRVAAIKSVSLATLLHLFEGVFFIFYGVDGIYLLICNSGFSLEWGQFILLWVIYLSLLWTDIYWSSFSFRLEQHRYYVSKWHKSPRRKIHILLQDLSIQKMNTTSTKTTFIYKHYHIVRSPGLMSSKFSFTAGSPTQ